MFVLLKDLAINRTDIAFYCSTLKLPLWPGKVFDYIWGGCIRNFYLIICPCLRLQLFASTGKEWGEECYLFLIFFYIVIGIFHIFICSAFYSYLIIKQHFLKKILKCYVLIPLKKTPRKLIFKARPIALMFQRSKQTVRQ